MFAQQNVHGLTQSTSGGPDSPGDVSSEVSPLLGARSDQHHQHSIRTPSTSPSPSIHRHRSTWHQGVSPKSLRKKSSALSDILSGRNHSSPNLWAAGLDHHNEDIEGEGAPHDPDTGAFGTFKRRRSLRGQGYDGQFKAELEGEGANGLRMWYDNYSVLDWLHDSIKDSVRRRNLQHRKRSDGLRGRIAATWDKAQGWVVVTLVGFLTACIAFGIISLEMWAFDLKDGYCGGHFFTAKRFCCATAPSAPARLGLLGWSRAPAVVHAPASSTRFLAEDTCDLWITWGQLWDVRAGAGGSTADWVAEHVVFLALALLFSFIPCAMTIYLTSSASVFSSKDSPAVPHAGEFSPEFLSLASASSTLQSTPPELTTQFGTAPLADSSFEQPKVANGKLEVPHGRPRKVTYHAAGSGIPQIKVILSGFVIRGYLGVYTLGVKSVGLALSVASGLSLGKEGPFVHIASCVGNIVSRFFPKYDLNEAKRREVISAACAAGVAVSFGAPVGGVLFALEETATYFPAKVMFRSFWCAMIAAASLRFFDPFGSGKIVLFAVTYDQDWLFSELPGFLALGVFGGVYGALFCKANAAWSKRFRAGAWLGRHPIWEVALITALTTVVAWQNTFAKMGGTELVSELFTECHKHEALSGLCVKTPDAVWPIVGSILFALATKAVLTVITFGITLPAGIFVPSLAVGACAGRVAGLLVELLHARHPEWAIFNECRAAMGDGPLPFGQACVVPGVWAMVGAVATLAGVTRTTISLAVIMFELTNSIQYTIPVIMAILISKITADAIESRSIYDLTIANARLPYLDVKEEHIHELNLADIVDTDAPVISLDDDNSFTSLHDKLAALYASGTGGGFPIVAAEDGGIRHFGYIASKELEYGLSRSAMLQSPLVPCTFRTAQAIRAGGSAPTSRVATPGAWDLSLWVDQAPVVISVNSPMELCHEMFAKLGLRYLVVVDERGLYKGVVEKNRYLAYLHWLESTGH